MDTPVFAEKGRLVGAALAEARTEIAEPWSLVHSTPLSRSPQGDEIGVLTTAFNQMVVQLRVKEQIRETFGKYMDPRIVEGLIDRPALTGAGGERRVMTIFFCDMKGFHLRQRGTDAHGPRQRH